MSGAVRILLVEDQVLMRCGLRKLLEMEEDIEVIAEAADGIEALRRVADSHPDVALVDAPMPRMNGVELIARLGREHPEVGAIILTMFEADEYIFGGLQAGARGYLLKDTPPDEVVAAIRKVSRGETILDGAIATRVVGKLRQVAGSARGSAPDPDVGFAGEELLSAREAEVARLIARAATNHEIAVALFVTDGTVKNHISGILRKLGLRDRTQLAVHVLRSNR